MGLSNRLKHAWDVFKGEDRSKTDQNWVGGGYSHKPDRPRVSYSSVRTVVAPIYNRIGIDVSSIPIRHIKVDENERFVDVIKSQTDEVLTVNPNLDQTGRGLFLDAVISLLDEGCIAIVPTKTDVDPNMTDGYIIKTLRVGRILEWFPSKIRVRVYNEDKGIKEDILVDKKFTCIIENPLYLTMNEPNSTLKRLVDKLNILDAVDQRTGAGKLDLIIQLPYIIKTAARKEQAEKRRQNIEDQLSNSKYGIAYADGTEKIIQLNRPVTNELLPQIEKLIAMLYSQLGLTESVFDGTADEQTMLNYFNRTVEPILSAITEEMSKKFLTKTARTRGHKIHFIRNPFKLVPINDIAEIADKFARNAILSSNDFRAIIGFKPSKQKMAEELSNKNMPAEKIEPTKNKKEEELDEKV